MKPGIFLFALVLLPLLSSSRSADAAQKAPFVWLEAERATANIPLEAKGWGHKEFLSEDKWLQVSIDADKIDRQLPEGGAVLKYALDVPESRNYEIWDRIGYEFARSPFEWRIDGGAWSRISPDALTTDLMELETWNEVAWLKLGGQNLTAGAHALEIRLPKTLGKDGKPERVLYASDALCVYGGEWHPYGKLKPGEDHQSERDRAAATKTFSLPESPGEGRTTLPLAGDWEVCRADEQTPPFDVAQPMETDLPPEAKWSAIPVPSDKNASRPDLLFAHRLWYRTKVSIPAGKSSSGYFLTFPRNNLNTTVVVNGVFCGFNKNPNAPFEIDITKAVKAGTINELRVGIRDAWYGYSTSPSDPLKLRKKFNLPLSVVGTGFQDLAYPIWNAWQSGMVQTPTLTRTGGAQIRDVFVQPDVDGKRVKVSFTIRHNAGLPRYEIIDEKTGEVVARSATHSAFLGAGGPEVVAVNDFVLFPEGKLWWPEPKPQLYTLRILCGDDALETRFGFREWGAKGKDFTLNGQVWHGWADLNGGATPSEWLENYRASGQRFMRLSGYAQGGPTWQGLLPSQALDFFDENGVVVRRSGDLDGEAIGYMAIESDEELKKLYNSPIKIQLLKNWKDQYLQQVTAERNHPSIHVWSLENEFLYINAINLYGGLMDDFEKAALETGDAVTKIDPTRLWMTDGGGAGSPSRFPIHGDHYIFSENDGRYPDLAYEANPAGGGRGRWLWDQTRPRYAGEDYFATGINPADYAMLGGEEVFGGKAETYPAAGKIQRMLTEGYRWAGYGAWHLWLGRESAVNQYGSNSEIAAIVRENDWSFLSGRKISRTIGIFNDSFHIDAPITLKWALTLAGKQISTGSQTVAVPRGENRKISLALSLPAAATRTEGVLTLTASANGRILFRDAKLLSVLPEPAVRPSSANLSVYDPSGKVTSYLNARKIRFSALSSLEKLPPSGVLLVGPDALTPVEATSPKLAAFTAAGGRAIVLEQKNPLKFTAIPAEISSTGAEGRVAFLEDAAHPALAGLSNRDFFTWGINKPVYRGAYEKPARGGKSLVECDARLGKSALVEVPVGPGLLLLCQLAVGDNLSGAAAAPTLLTNLLNYAVGYKRTLRAVTAVAAPGSPLIEALDAAGVAYKRAGSLLPKPTDAPGLWVVDATPANLKVLADAKPQVDVFTKAGGYILLHGLTPEGLSSYSKLVGIDHLIRPFKREKLGLATQRKSALAAGIAAGDVSQLSGVRIFPWTSDEYVADDIFTYVVDEEDMARFGHVPDYKYFGLGDANNDHNPENIYNGFTTTDGWVFAFMQWAGGGLPKAVPLTFDRPRTFTALQWTGNALYNPATKLALTFDGKTRRELAVRPGGDPQSLSIDPPVTASKVELQIVEWRKDRPDQPLVGIDNVKLTARRDPDYFARVRPLTDVGGLIEYKSGAGGIVLCNLNFKKSEAVPVNGAKKRSIFAAILRNLKAPFSGGAAVVPGAAGIEYASIDIGKKANQFRNEKGWLGDAKTTFAALPTGAQTFGGVPFTIYDFPTSPVPTAIVLGGPGVPGNLPERVGGIAVNRRAGALFFLQTARIDREMQDGERREKKRFELARYVITYADGGTETVPIYQGESVADYRQKSPQGLPGASLGWSRPYDGLETSASAWVQQWNNPHPERGDQRDRAGVRERSARRPGAARGHGGRPEIDAEEGANAWMDFRAGITRSNRRAIRCFGASPVRCPFPRASPRCPRPWRLCTTRATRSSREF